MKKPLLILILLIKIVSANAQSPVNDVNYVRTTNVTVKGKTTSLQIESAPIDQRLINYTYFDGLGRPIQTVMQEGSPLGNDIVQPIVYDAFGREIKKYLPFVANSDGYYKPNEQIINAAGDYIGIAQPFYAAGSDNKIADSPYPYSQTVFEPSPLNRVLKQGAPGSAWQPDAINSYMSSDRTIKQAYESNTVEDAVLLWTYSYPTDVYPLGLIKETSEELPSVLNYYAPNELIKTRTKDEEGHEVIEYIDKEGRTILKRVQAVTGNPAINDTNYASTYYIYDDFGSLVCVLPPEATKRLADEYYQSGATASSKLQFLERWAFRYAYDELLRMKIKQVPGADSVSMVYDDRDRLVFTQDGNQRSQNKWMFTKYDQLNRPIITGIYTHPSSVTSKRMRDEISTTIFSETYNGVGATHGYTNNLFPQTGIILTVTYYDNYAFRDNLNVGSPNNLSAYNFKSDDISGQETTPWLKVIGLVTGTKVNVLNTSDYLWGVTYYDSKYRPVQSIASNYRGGTDLTTSVVDFIGKVLKTKTTMREPGKTDLAVHRRFEYDHAGRLTKTWHKIKGDSEVLLSMAEYNELGQLITKDLHKEAVAADPAVGQPGVVYAADIVLSQYDPAITTYVATNSITLQPGFSVPSGSSFTARIGYSQEDADAHNATLPFAQAIDFRYNIRGWLDNINEVDASNSDDYFSMDLNYNDPVTNGGEAQYNGNISQTLWKGPDGEKKSYGYYYDPMNRLKEGRFYNSSMATKNGRFTEKIGDDPAAPAYDLNGNILNLFRYGKTGEDPSTGMVTYGLMDDMAYDYTNTGNRLNKVTDDAIDIEGFKDGANTDNDYDYDANGNMHMDKNKDLNANSITYNDLNLPQRVEKSPTKYVQYIYDATGRKLRQIAVDGTTKTTDYVGEFIYENNVLQFINHEEGRVVMTRSSPEYQYHLKDHLGNVRTTFTTIEETETLVATLETAKEDDDRANFLKYDDIRKVNYALFDHTNTGSTKYALRLTGTTKETYGLARSIAVMPGDKIKAKVFAKYLDLTDENILEAVRDFIVAIPTATGGTVIDGGAYGTPDAASIPFPYRVPKSGQPAGVPKAYLNWLVFDKDHNPIVSKCGYEPITDQARETGQLGPEGKDHEELVSDEIEITEAGYVYIYLSNEEEGYEVYFDDFSVEQVKSPIVQSDDYYPFGLTFNSSSRENSVANMYQYNGKEKQDELDLGWLDYGARMYDASLGRWNKIDKLTEKFAPLSPYTYAACNPIIYIDINGDDIYYFDEKGYYTGYMVKDGGPNRGVYGGEEFIFGDQEHDHLNLVHYKEEDEIYYDKNIWFRVEGENGLDIDRRIEEVGAYDVNNKWDGLKKILQKKGEGIQDMGIGMERDDAKFGTHTIISTAKGKVSFSARNYGNFLLAILFAVMTDGMIDGEDTKFFADQYEKWFGEDWADSRDDQKAIELGGEYYKDHYSNNGNTGTYNKRSSDQNYSDDFLKWYYDDGDDDDKK